MNDVEGEAEFRHIGRGAWIVVLERKLDDRRRVNHSAVPFTKSTSPSCDGLLTDSQDVTSYSSHGVRYKAGRRQFVKLTSRLPYQEIHLALLAGAVGIGMSLALRRHQRMKRSYGKIPTGFDADMMRLALSDTAAGCMLLH